MSTDTISFIDIQDRLLTVKELSSYIGVHPETIRRWKGKGPKRSMIGSQIRYKESDVLLWIKECNERHGQK